MYFNLFSLLGAFFGNGHFKYDLHDLMTHKVRFIVDHRTPTYHCFYISKYIH